jgi:CxxC motif-containing protein (DUF1111 family)
MSPRSLLLAGASVLLASVGFSQDFQPRMGDPVPGLTPAQKLLFTEGQTVFDAPLSVAEGLGPIMNDESCGICHQQPAVGGASTRKVNRFGRAANGMLPFDPLDGLGGTLQQEQTIDLNCVEVIPPEADVTAERMTPHVFGSGLLEAVSDADILFNEANQAPGLSGYVRMVNPVEGGPPRAGRFGWKGGVATLFTFSADAAFNEMGLTSVFFPTENAPNGDLVALAACDTVADPEDFPDAGGRTKIQRFTDFQRLLAAPPQTPKSGMSGAAIFEMVGCGDCHLSRTYTTQTVAEAALSGVEIRPFSDFLVHDMGTLGDGIVDGPVTETEFMTRALWGLQARGGAMLHDGRATLGGSFRDNIVLAIAEHGGEASASRAAAQALSGPEIDRLAAFLGSLGKVEFDWEGDNDVDEIDWFFLLPLMTGPTPVLTPDHEASVADFDGDGDFDMKDFAVLQRAWTN